MSSFSSVVRKPGSKIAPKAAPRRVQRNKLPSATPEIETGSPSVEHHAERPNATRDPDQVAGIEEVVLASETSALPVVAQPEESPVSRSSPEVRRSAIPPVAIDVDDAPAVVESNIPTEPQIPVIARSISPTRAPSIPSVAVSAPPVHPRKRRAPVEPTPSASEESAGSALEDSTPQDDAEVTSTVSQKRRRTSRTLPDPSRQAQEPTPVSDSTPLTDVRSRPRFQRSESRTSEVLLQDATNSAAAVSELANSINDRTRSTRSLSAQIGVPVVAVDGTTQRSTPSRARRRKRRSRDQAIEDTATGADDQATRRSTGGRVKAPTPDDAEDHELDPEEVSMGSLVKDNRLGKKSETEKKMQENWAEVKARRKEATEKRREAAEKKTNPVLEPPRPVAANPQASVKVHIVDGQLVVDNASREVAFSNAAQAVIDDAAVAKEDDRIYRYVNQGTIGKKAGLRRPTKWDEQMIDTFYQGIRMFGTDFQMIANMIPGKTRRQIKMKYIAEERNNLAKLMEARGATQRKTVTLDHYQELTQMEFDDPKKVQDAMDAEEQRIREEDERRRREEGYEVHHEGADVPIPSTEVDEHGNERTGDRSTDLTAHVVHPAVSSKRRAQTRGTKEPGTGPGRGRGRRGLVGAEGVEEAIGPVGEVAL